MGPSRSETHDGGEAVFIGIIRGITNREAAELAQRESELRRRATPRHRPRCGRRYRRARGNPINSFCLQPCYVDGVLNG